MNFGLRDEREDVYCSDEMQCEYHWNPDVEFLVLRFVSPHLKTQPCANASADDGKQDERRFRNAPLRFLGLKFVDAVDDEGDEVEGEQSVDDYLKHKWGRI